MIPYADVLKEEMSLVNTMLDKALADTHNGKETDLSEMQLRAEKLCASILELPGKDAKSFQPDIAAVIQKLDTLEKALQEQVKNA